MSDHDELIAEMLVLDKMSTGERLKHARKKRSQQLKKFAQYEKELTKKNKTQSNASKPSDTRHRRRIQFVSNVILLEAAMRNDIEEGITSFVELFVCVCFRHATRPTD